MVDKLMLQVLPQLFHDVVVLGELILSTIVLVHCPIVFVELICEDQELVVDWDFRCGLFVLYCSLLHQFFVFFFQGDDSYCW